ncbi:cytochrome b561 [Caenispirillum salinarum AK4]|uniref:Cytochrome b561 n=1 Tax=Caenispirillum salinarum AK4 TaxID=1238182 RepID=K9GXX3_9PROT|nr:cytochrome b/b6 domain-containing protein [Caenispirillum salinarum]EKV30860.1 cytochrome b561 [Caenispirillum salinarum AK4]
MAREVMFTRFERLWHWTQALIIVGLAITGFEVFGSWTVFGYETATEVHQILAWLLLGLWALAMFWHMTTGEWRQYIPTFRNMGAVMRYYTAGIFDPSIEHPYKPTRKAKHNPMQRLAYLGFLVVIMPVLWITGLLYMFYNGWEALGLGFLSLGAVALVHVMAAFALVIFFIGHVYMGFTGRPATAYVKAMITGYGHDHSEGETPSTGRTRPAE